MLQHSSQTSVLQGSLMQTALVGSSIGITPNLILTSQYAQERSKKSPSYFTAAKSRRALKIVQSPHKNTFYCRNGGGKPNEDLSFAWGQQESKQRAKTREAQFRDKSLNSRVIGNNIMDMIERPQTYQQSRRNIKFENMAVQQTPLP